MNSFVEDHLRLTAPLAAAPTIAGVPDHCQQPGLAVTAAEAIEESESPQVRLLRYILRVMFIAHQPAGETISCVQMRKNRLFKERKLGGFSHFRLCGFADRDRPCPGRDRGRR